MRTDDFRMMGMMCMDEMCMCMMRYAKNEPFADCF